MSLKNHLLALDASIEAACAGEAGKRFSVVAVEVKFLAIKTSLATTDIAGKIREICSFIEKNEKAIGSIREDITGLSSVASKIAQATTERSTSTGKIASSVAQAAEQVRRHLVKVTDASHDTGVAYRMIT